MSHVKHTVPELSRGQAAKFWAAVKRLSAAECWPWKNAVSSSGYGRVAIGGVQLNAHRVAWSLVYGLIPESMFILHTCDNRRCCNPAHLYPGTVERNAADMVKRGRDCFSQRTHCIRGHEYNSANTRWRVQGHRRWRICRACECLHAREYRQQAAALDAILAQRK
jgi:hypothetical protein